MGNIDTGFLATLGPQFLVAQFFTILATILGVYLAGYVNFKRTLERDALVRARQHANLLTALLTELEDNTRRLREFVPMMEKTQEGIEIFDNWPRLHLFFWRALAKNPILFDMAPKILADMQIFYETIGRTMGDSKVQEYFGMLTSTNAYYRKQITEQFDAQVKFAETSLLPGLKRAAASANELVAKYPN